MTRRSGIPTVTDARLAPFANTVKEILETGLGQRGNGDGRFVTYGDLNRAGLAGSLGANLIRYDDTGNPPDLTTPPPITGLIANGTLTNILLEWDPVLIHNLSYIEIWRSTVNDRTQADRVGVARGTLYADPVGMDSTYYYWVRAVSTADIIGPWNTAYNAGTQGATPASTETIMASLTEQIRPGQIVWKEQVVYETDLFAIVSPRAEGDVGLEVPFIVGNVGGTPTVGVNGQLVVDGTILADAIGAGQVTADKISVVSLSAISANLGAVTAGSADIGAGSWKVKISDTGYPLEYRNTVGGEQKFYLDAAGNAYFKGEIAATSGTFVGSITAGSTITGATITGGTLDVGTPGFHIASNGDIWSGHASYASAPFRVDAGTGHVYSGLSANSTHMNSGQLWTGSSSYSSAPFRVDSDGDLIANSIKAATMTAGGQPEIGNLYVDAARVKNLTADKILAGTLQAGVIVGGSLISGEITTAFLYADRIYDNVNTWGVGAAVDLTTSSTSFVTYYSGSSGRDQSTQGYNVIVVVKAVVEEVVASVTVEMQLKIEGSVRDLTRLRVPTEGSIQCIGRVWAPASANNITYSVECRVLSGSTTAKFKYGRLLVGLER